MSAESQLAKKIKLEQTYRREVKSLFNRMMASYKISIATTGLPSDATKYIPHWQALTDNHIIRVQKEFMGEATAGLKSFSLSINLKKETEEDKKKKELLALALLMWRERESIKQAKLITDTNIKDQKIALSLARESAVPTIGVPPADNRTISMLASAILAKRNDARTQSIIMSQTQSAAESTKFIEAEVASGQTPRIISPNANLVSQTTKTWHTMGDSRVRDIHRRANGQRVNMNIPFIVNNQQLWHPGDSSLGASANNVINCRCVALYSF